MAAQRTTHRLPVVDPARISSVIARIGCSPIEEDFFRTGEQLAADTGPHSFADLDEGYTAPTVWSAIRAWMRGEPR